MVAPYTDIADKRDKKLYLSSIKTFIPSTTVSFSEYKSFYNKNVNKYDHQNPLHWFFKDNKVKFTLKDHFYFQDREEEQENTKIPICTMKQSDYAVECVVKELTTPQKIDVFCYCHETLEESHSILPALKIKTLAGLQKAMAFSIGHLSSLAFLSTVDLSKALFLDEPVEQMMGIINDSVVPPFLRVYFNENIRGDASTVFTIDSRNCGYEIVKARIYNQQIRVPFLSWKITDFQQAEKQLIDQTKRIISDLSREIQIDWIITQHISAHYLQTIHKYCMDSKRSMYKRTTWADINFLGSDPFISLEELAQSKQLLPDQTIALIFSSLDIGVGYVLLKNKNKPRME